MVDECEKRRQESIAFEKEEQARLVEELNELGFDVSSPFYLGQPPREEYDEAIPILLDHLKKPYSKPTKDMIYRKLAVKWIKGKALENIIEILFKDFETEQDDDLRWTIGLVLGNLVRQKKYLDRLRKLLKNKKYGFGRSELVICYAKVGKQEVVKDLISFLSDRDLLQNSIVELGKLKVKEAKPHIEVLANHDEMFFRDLAKKTLKKIQS